MVKILKKIISFLLCILVLSTYCVSFAASVDNFSDVKSSDWFYQYVKNATERNLFNGTSTTTFSPQSNMTKGMFITVLGRYAGINGDVNTTTVAIPEPINLRAKATTKSEKLVLLNTGNMVTIIGEESGEKYSSGDMWYKVKYQSYTGYIRGDLITVCQFTDVKLTDYYRPYIVWATNIGISEGTSKTTYSPNENITREEICYILNNFINYKKYTTNSTISKTTFSDDSSINSKYKDAVYAMQAYGVVNGRENNNFAPKTNATRAEVATFYTRFINFIENSPKTDYSYSGTTPESASVQDAWFNDACFIGHSMVVGMKLYFNLPNADYYAVNGISANRMLTYDQFELKEQNNDSAENEKNTGTLKQALQEKSYSKVYIMLGINEVGSTASARQNYENSMNSLISMVKEVQPYAKIYLISIIPVTEERSLADETFNRENIVEFNKVLQRVSKNNSVEYLDFFTLFCNDDGYFPAECAASDGLHPVQSQYTIMKNYIKKHT